ncbi:MAG: LysE family transporter [Agriterribacter sp.]
MSSNYSMRVYLRIFYWAFGISFLGSLPLGTLNVTVTNLVVNKGVNEAIQFAAAAVLVEIIMVRIAVVTIHKLEKQKKLFKLFSVITCAILLTLAAISLKAAIRMENFEAALPLTERGPLLSGFILSILNPLHLPFWIGWTAVLRSRKILVPEPKAYNIYVVAIGMGTSAAFVVYALAGSLVITLLKDKQYLLNWFVGIALLITAIIILYKTFRKPLRYA